MNVEFADDDLAQLEVSSESSKWSEAITKAFRRRMQLIRAAPDERDFYALKSLHFEKMSGPRRHQHSMRLNDQFRLVMELEGKGESKSVKIVGIEDYH